jgi:hypothetical protein
MHIRRCVVFLFTMNIPLQFCWTRFGTEAAQSINQILVRKEEERQANHGLFLWGIGNPVGPSILELVRRASVPEVIFSPIKSAPREEDVAPPAVVAWTAGSTICGDRYVLPETVLVTSRFVPSQPRRSHYALVCYSEQQLRMVSSDRRIALGSLRNLVSGRKVGASQVTAVVERTPDTAQDTSQYSVSMRARLVPPFFVKLTEHVVISCEFDDATREKDWACAVGRHWAKKSASSTQLVFSSAS